MIYITDNKEYITRLYKEIITEDEFLSIVKKEKVYSDIKDSNILKWFFNNNIKTSELVFGEKITQRYYISNVFGKNYIFRLREYVYKPMYF